MPTRLFDIRGWDKGRWGGELNQVSFLNLNKRVIPMQMGMTPRESG
ncbi:MAG: hypothetical protein QNJ46_24230 [Leptolyngbyaceae cyanobacterium MO_188.B28]|nr:hypothetical protein [Leptolyngbyaceae cyanobacterium MO_188.B28]